MAVAIATAYYAYPRRTIHISRMLAKGSKRVFCGHSEDNDANYDRDTVTDDQKVSRGCQFAMQHYIEETKIRK